ncbi:unnamed protein product [Trichobilharzia szidati]|nr:unnamed protein product [Trichobilharzia szidati]
MEKDAIARLKTKKRPVSQQPSKRCLYRSSNMERRYSQIPGHKVMDQGVPIRDPFVPLAESTAMDDPLFREEFDLLDEILETDRTERSSSREPDSINKPTVPLTEDDEEISPDLSDLLPKIRKIKDQNFMKPVDPELCQLLKLLSKGLSITDRQYEFSKYLRDQEKMHLPASSTSHREIMEMASSLSFWLS